MFHTPHIVRHETPAISHPMPAGVAGAREWAGLQALLGIVWQLRQWIVAGAILGVLGAGVFLLSVTARYVAVAELLIDPSDLRVVDNAVTSNSLQFDANAAQVESQVRVLTSDNVLRRVVDSQGLDRDPEFVGTKWRLSELLRSAARRVGLKSVGEPVPSPAAALRTLEPLVAARRQDKTYVVDLSVTTHDPDKSVNITNAIVQAYLADQAAARSEAARRATDSLSARLDELKNRVREAEEKAEAYKKDHDIVGTNGQLIKDQQLTEINNRLVDARARTAEAKARYEQIEHLRSSGADPGAIAEAVQSPTIANLRTQYAEVARRDAELTSRLGPRHPFVLDIKAQVRDFQRLIDGETARLAHAARGDYDRARANDRSLERSLDAAKRETASTHEFLVRLREFEREVEASRAVYQAFLVRSRETSEQERIDTANVRVLSEAALPAKKVWPPRGILVALAGLIVGAAGGVGGGFLRGRIDDRIRSRADLEAVCQLPIIAEIVDDAGIGQTGDTRFTFKASPEKPSVAAGTTVLDAPGSAFAARLRRLSDLVRTGAAGAGRVVLLMAPGEPGARPKIALNLALSAASAGGSVLLVDADAGARELTKRLDVQRSPGLADVAEHRVGFHDALLAEPRTGLLALTAGQSGRERGDDTEAAERIVKVLANARSFDLLVLDGPPPRSVTLARPLAAYADAVILVVTAGTTLRAEIVDALARIDLPPNKLRGILFVRPGRGS